MSEDTHKPQRSEASASAEDRGMRPGPRGDKDAMPEDGRRFKSKRRRKVSYLTLNKIDYVDYKEVNILRRFLNDRGKIVPSRQSGNTAKQQRMIASAIRKAREMALLPFVVTEMTADRREYGPRRDRNYDRPYTPRGDRGDREPRREEAPAPQEAPAAEKAAPAEAPAE
jgi:small subunit ribosomal protein S18